MALTTKPKVKTDEVKVAPTSAARLSGLSEGIVANREDLRARVDELAKTFLELKKTWGEFVHTVSGVHRAAGEAFDENALMDPITPRDNPEGMPTPEEVQAHPADDGEALSAILGTPERQSWAPHFSEAASRYDVPVTFLLAVTRMESSFNPRAKNGSHLGLGQIGSAEALAFKSSSDCPPEMSGDKFDAWNPRHNIFATAWILKNKRDDVNDRIKRGEYPEEYAIATGGTAGMDADDAKWWYRAYHDGARGSLSARTYTNNGTPETLNKLANFQKQPGALEAFDEYAGRVATQFTNYSSQNVA